MLDDDDFDFALLMFSPTGWITAIIGIAIIIAVGVAVSRNHDECAAKRCANGSAAILLSHECRCVDNPIDGGARD